MFITDLSIRRPVVSAVFSMILVVFGLFVFWKLPVRELPAGLQPPVVQVQVDYASASAPIIDPQKMDPNASRETLDHSIMYIFAVALEDASWHHVNSYKKSRANKKSTIKIWRSIKTHEDKKWTRKYHDPNPKNKSFGAKVVVTLNNNKKIIEQLDKADAHPYGLRPFVRKNYINKFLTLTKNILSKKESDRFLKTVQNLTKLKPGQLNKLNIEIKSSNLKKNNKKGIF